MQRLHRHRGAGLGQDANAIAIGVSDCAMDCHSRLQALHPTLQQQHLRRQTRGATTSSAGEVADHACMDCQSHLDQKHGNNLLYPICASAHDFRIPPESRTLGCTLHIVLLSIAGQVLGTGHVPGRVRLHRNACRNLGK